MRYSFFGDDVALSSAIRDGLNDGEIEQIIITSQGHDQIGIQIFRADKSKESGFEYVDEDDL